MKLSQFTAPTLALISPLLLTQCVKQSSERAQTDLEELGYEATFASLQTAVERGDLSAFPVFRKTKVNWKQIDPEKEESLLHIATRNGQLEATKRLVTTFRLPIDATNKNGETALFIAASNGQHEIVRFLIKQGASANHQNKDGYRPITIAAKNGQGRVIEELASYSRDHLDAALFLASIEGQYDVISTLTSYGASVYSRMDDGRTSLMLAAQEGHEEVAQLLINNGANRYAVNPDGLTAAQIATRFGHQTLAEALNKAPELEEWQLPSYEDSLNTIGTQIAQEDIPILKEEKKKTVIVQNKPTSTFIDVTQGQVAQATQPKPATTTQASKTPNKSLNGKTLQVSLTASGTDQETPTLRYESYRETPLPFIVEKVDGEKATVRYLYGNQERHEIHQGETIPNTKLKIVKATQRVDHSKATLGQFADISTLLIQDQGSGQSRELTTALTATSHQPLAILKDPKTGEHHISRQGDQFKTANGESYTITDIRPTQLVVRNNGTGEIKTIHYRN